MVQHKNANGKQLKLFKKIQESIKLMEERSIAENA